MFVAAASFGDGVAAVVLRSVAAAASERAAGAHRGIMGWDIKADGFGVMLSPQLPGLMHQELRPALEGFLERHGLERDGFCGFLSQRGPQDIRDRGERTWHRPRTLGALLGRAAGLRPPVVGEPCSCCSARSALKIAVRTCWRHSGLASRRISLRLNFSSSQAPPGQAPRHRDLLRPMATSPSGDYAWHRLRVDRAKFSFAISTIQGNLESYQIGSRSGRHVGPNAPTKPT
jgi:hypothetical protein